MKLNLLAIFFLIISVSCIGQKRRVVLEGTLHDSNIIYKNETALIRLAYVDIVNEIDRLKRTNWFINVDSSAKKRVDGIQNKLMKQVNIDSKRINNSSMVTTGGVMWHIEVNNKYHKNDSLLVALLKKYIVGSLLFKGKAFVWKRTGVIQMDRIIVISNKEFSGNDSSSFYFNHERKPFFTGMILKDADLIPDNNVDSISHPIKIAETERSEVDTSKVYSIVDQMPDFPGGRQQWIKAVKMNLPNPELKIKQSISSDFIVETDGTVSGVRIFKGGGSPEFNSAIAKAIMDCHGWIPGKEDKINVRVQMLMVIPSTD